MTQNEYNEGFIKKYSTEVESQEIGSPFYGYKNGEFSAEEVIGMQTLPTTCKETTFQHAKDTTQEYTELGSFISEDGYREADLQIPICGNC